MTLNHLSLGVTEIPKTVQLLEDYFGLRRVERAPFSDHMAFVNDDGGALLTIFKVDDANYPNIFHIGFIQDTTEQVMDLHRRLTTAGFQPGNTREEYGRLTFYFKAPGGFTIEVNAFIKEAFAARNRSTVDTKTQPLA